jgi:Sec-independent protein secretion pathway component TatC
MFEQTKSRLMSQTRGAGVVSAVILVVAGTAIGYFVVVNILNGINRSGFSVAQNTTFDTVVTNTNTAITMLAILGIVVAAGAVLASLG